ncbi:MAG: hypothetical protein IH840_07300, partial [Candidatus Heimdallarchaeota archaeon]|nr:hypothetical protein [Candidatus Heimdallarchaeota archaeon]
MKKLDIEHSEEYKEAEVTIEYLIVLKNYYSTSSNFDELEMGNIKLRELFRFMSEHDFPKKGFVSDNAKEKYVINIDAEIINITKSLRDARLEEIKNKELNSILIIPSWGNVLGYKTKGFYLNRPVLEVKKDTIVMLSHDIIEVKDKFGNDFAVLTGPGIFFTEFSLDQGSHITNHREINMIIIPNELLSKMLDAPPIFTSSIKATMNELISIIPFSLIEEAETVQALLRGVISRNIFHPNKAALDVFLEEIKSPRTYHPNDGFKILSAHKEFFNRLLLSQPPPQAKGDSSYNL